MTQYLLFQAAVSDSPKAFPSHESSEGDSLSPEPHPSLMSMRGPSKTVVSPSSKTWRDMFQLLRDEPSILYEFMSSQMKLNIIFNSKLLKLSYIPLFLAEL